MKSASKQDLILEAIIKAYLEENLPIGSHELQSKIPIEISASSIRAYFKRLSDEGVLMQLHISGGRIPTRAALKRYWLSRLETDSAIVLGSLSHVRNVVRDYGLYCALEVQSEERLDEVITVGTRYLLLVFGSGEIAISYSPEALRFLNEMVGLSVHDIRLLSHRVGFDELSVKLDRMMVGNVLFQEGDDVLYEMTREDRPLYGFFKERTALDMKEGIYFEEVVPSGYMALISRAFVGGARAKMLTIGTLESDFEGFLKKAKETHERQKPQN
jgi:heat-inducible transcriptional repressor